MNKWYLCGVLMVGTAFSLEAHRSKHPGITQIAAIRMGTEDVPMHISGIEHGVINSFYGYKHGSVRISDCRKLIITDLRNIIQEDDQDSTLLLKVVSSHVIIEAATCPFKKIIVSVSGGSSVIFKQRPAECIVVNECVNGSSLTFTNNDQTLLTVLVTESCVDSSFITAGNQYIMIQKSSYISRIAGMIYAGNKKTRVCSQIKKLMRVVKR